MAQTITPAVIFPRFTAIVGAFAYPSLPLDVTAFQTAKMTFWRGPFVGTNTSLVFRFQESTDRYTWSDTGAQVVPDENDQKQVGFDLDQQWLRLVATLTGTNPGATVWVQGYFINGKE